MCYVQIALAVAGTAMQMYSQSQQAKSQSNMAKYQAQVAENNAAYAEQNAQAALQRGEADKDDKRRETSQRAGLQRAQLAAMGFDVHGGSSIDILADTAALGELDVLRIDADAENRARNYRIQGSNFEAEAGLGRYAAKSYKRAGKTAMFSSLITGAGQSYGAYSDYQGRQGGGP